MWDVIVEYHKNQEIKKEFEERGCTVDMFGDKIILHSKKPMYDLECMNNKDISISYHTHTPSYEEGEQKG